MGAEVHVIAFSLYMWYFMITHVYLLLGAERCSGPSDYHFLADALREIKTYANPMSSPPPENSENSNNNSNNYSVINSSTNKIVKRAEAHNDESSFYLQVSNLMDRLLGVLENSLRVEKYKSDPDMVSSNAHSA